MPACSFLGLLNIFARNSNLLLIYFREIYDPHLDANVASHSILKLNPSGSSLLLFPKKRMTIKFHIHMTSMTCWMGLSNPKLFLGTIALIAPQKTQLRKLLIFLARQKYLCFNWRDYKAYRKSRILPDFPQNSVSDIQEWITNDISYTALQELYVM